MDACPERQPARVVAESEHANQKDFSMRTRAALTAVLLAACSVACLATPSAAAPALGAYADPAGGGHANETAVTTFETSLGHTLSVDNTYSSFAWTGPMTRQIWDISTGRMPMKSWSPGAFGVSCVLFTDVTAGKYDAQLKAQAALVKALPGFIWLRLFYEMTDTPSETCANPTKSGPVYIAAWQHVVGLFRAAGVTNVKWVWAPGQPAYFENIELNFYPGSAWVDVVGEDVYNYKNTPIPFEAAGGVCTVGPTLHKPFAITETGAIGSVNQLAWLKNMNTLCPGLTALVYWDGIGGVNSYAITDPAVFQELHAIGQ
jgi:hypothetical protein